MTVSALKALRSVRLFSAVRPRSARRPTREEAACLDAINNIRADPRAYGERIGLDLSAYRPAPPLAFDPVLAEAAWYHSLDMARRRYFDHRTPEGVDPGGQIAVAGFAWRSWGQSVAAGYRTADESLKAMVVDDGVPSLSHRRHLLAVDGVFRRQRFAGVGFVRGVGPYRTYITVNTAERIGVAVEPDRIDPEQFVRRLYVLVARRQPTGKELHDAVVQIGQPGGRLAVVERVVGSPDGRERQIAGWFRSYLGRSPTADETRFYRDALAHGVPEEEAQARVVGSDEFFANARLRGGPPNPTESFIAAAYRVVFNREPTADEVLECLRRLDEGGRQKLALAMFYSPEFRRSMVRRYFQIVGTSEPAAADVEFWADTDMRLRDIRVNFMAMESWRNEIATARPLDMIAR